MIADQIRHRVSLVVGCFRNVDDHLPSVDRPRRSHSRQASLDALDQLGPFGRYLRSHSLSALHFKPRLAQWFVAGLNVLTFRPDLTVNTLKLGL